jgi:hypothetical protein
MAPIAATKPDQISSIRNHLDETRAWFSRKETIAQIEDVVPATQQWLEDNEEHYPPSLTRTAGPWRTIPQPTSDAGKRRARLRGLGYQVYEHGMLNFLDRLSDVGVVEKPVPIEIRALATDSDTIPVIEQLIMDENGSFDLWSSSPHSSACRSGQHQPRLAIGSSSASSALACCSRERMAAAIRSRWGRSRRSSTAVFSRR